jgi:hypothetical protein
MRGLTACQRFSCRWGTAPRRAWPEARHTQARRRSGRARTEGTYGGEGTCGPTPDVEGAAGSSGGATTHTHSLKGEGGTKGQPHPVTENLGGHHRARHQQGAWRSWTGHPLKGTPPFSCTEHQRSFGDGPPRPLLERAQLSVS